MELDYSVSFAEQYEIEPQLFLTQRLPLNKTNCHH